MRARSVVSTLLISAAFFCGSGSLDAKGRHGTSGGGGGGHRGSNQVANRSPNVAAGGGGRALAGGRSLQRGQAFNGPRNLAGGRSLGNVRAANFGRPGQFQASSGNFAAQNGAYSQLDRPSQLRSEFRGLPRSRGTAPANAVRGEFVGPVQFDQQGNEVNPSASHPMLREGSRNFRAGHVNVVPNQNGQRGAWAQDTVANSKRLNRLARRGSENGGNQAPSFAEAKQRHEGIGRHFGKGNGKCDHHDKKWWRNHCKRIVLINFGYWGWHNGWWYPAWGYDSYYTSYAYDGPIYGYDGLTPDQIVASIQIELHRLGYYQGPIDGVFGYEMQEALQRFQYENGLPATGAIDPPTVRSLGLTR